LLSCEVKEKEIIQLPCAIVPTEQVHTLPKNRRRGSVTRLRPKTISSNLKPFTVRKVEPIEIVAVMSIIPTENVELVVENHCRMRMAG
jgi:hypothetical protein